MNIDLDDDNKSSEPNEYDYDWKGKFWLRM